MTALRVTREHGRIATPLSSILAHWNPVRNPPWSPPPPPPLHTSTVPVQDLDHFPLYLSPSVPASSPSCACSTALSPPVSPFQPRTVRIRLPVCSPTALAARHPLSQPAFDRHLQVSTPAHAARLKERRQPLTRPVYPRRNACYRPRTVPPLLPAGNPGPAATLIAAT